MFGGNLVRGGLAIEHNVWGLQKWQSLQKFLLDFSATPEKSELRNSHENEVFVAPKIKDF